MGCDIHLAVEVRTDGRWQRVLPPPEARDPWYVEEAALGKTWAIALVDKTWYSDRNYELFSILAGVRGNQEPIDEPRGLPGDMSPEVAALQGYMPDDISLGDHSHSWLTLAELQAYPWPFRTRHDAFCTRVLPALAKLGAAPQDVRIVFGFDS